MDTYTTIISTKISEINNSAAASLDQCACLLYQLYESAQKILVDEIENDNVCEEYKEMRSFVAHQWFPDVKWTILPEEMSEIRQDSNNKVEYVFDITNFKLRINSTIEDINSQIDNHKLIICKLWHREFLRKEVVSKQNMVNDILAIREKLCESSQKGLNRFINDNFNLQPDEVAFESDIAIEDINKFIDSCQITVDEIANKWYDNIEDGIKDISALEKSFVKILFEILKKGRRTKRFEISNDIYDWVNTWSYHIPWKAISKITPEMTRSNNGQWIIKHHLKYQLHLTFDKDNIVRLLQHLYQKLTISPLSCIKTPSDRFMIYELYDLMRLRSDLDSELKSYIEKYFAVKFVCYNGDNGDFFEFMQAANVTDGKTTRMALLSDKGVKIRSGIYMSPIQNNS